MQKSTISTQTNHVDIKKYSSNRKTDAVMTKHTAPFTLRFMTSSSESSFAVPALDSYSIKDYINTITHNYSNRSNKRAEMKISGVKGMPLLKFMDYITISISILVTLNRMIDICFKTWKF